MTRAQKIAKGKIWNVYFDATPDDVLHEGSLTSCRKFITAKNWWRLHKRGEIRLGKLLWEDLPCA